MNNGNENTVSILSILQQLSLEGMLSKSAEELTFRMLNRTIALCPYDRSVFFEQGFSGLKLKGISGQAAVNKTSELNELWNRLAAGLLEPHRGRLLTKDDFPEGLHEDWNSYVQKNAGTAVLWFPLAGWGKHVGGLWFERWSGRQWKEQEQQLLIPLIMSYGGAWERLHPRRPFVDKVRALTRRKFAMFAILAIVLVLLLVRLPLRVVAPCEVVAEDPFIVSAPLDGVVGEVAVNPGEKVAKGDLLFEYDRRTAFDELKVAREQVLIIKSSLDRVRMQAFADPRAKSEIAILEHRLDQEKARYKLAEYNVSMLEVRAEVPGVVVIADPEKWRGRPVSVGERVLSIVAPDRTKVRIWIPEDDNMTFDLKTPVRVLLNVIPEDSLSGRLEFVGSEVVTGPQRTASVLAEAKWNESDPRVKIGLKGISVLYGEKVSLAYWLFRKPWAAFNKFSGI
ncbi:HlyD family efflux transporter periplasmic adaptor subunit [Maridesulfovibrio sp.]|uniref:efflux RND transporter periplasmic adaptor subunit n=1 Tax=Maridesulfovibrio sp. TaxID=2795000 RepID=UPI002A187FCA|nr:HlyD family efflux transporter periplasmic adaptor subunit [Maridesulfovibrio sp.]